MRQTDNGRHASVQRSDAARHPIDGPQHALWAATAVAEPDSQPLQESLQCDVTIIGAGFTGLSAALHLAQSGTSVCVLEAGALGQGSSGRSGGQVNIGLNAGPQQLLRLYGRAAGERMVRTVVKVPEQVFGVIREHELECDAVQQGWVQGANGSRQVDAQRSLHREYAAFDTRFELLDREETQRRSGASGYSGGLYYSGSGSIQPLSYTRELARVALRKGARLFTHSCVTGLRQNSRGGWSISTAGGRVESAQVLVCTNAYTDGPNSSKDSGPVSGPVNGPVSGLNSKMVPVRSLIAATEPLPASLRDTLLPAQVTFSDKRRLLLYCRYDRDGRLCAGYHGPMRDTFSLSDFDALKQRAVEVFPALRTCRWDHHWGGRVAMTRNGLPFIHRIAPGLLAGMGYNGRGVGMGSMMGKLLADAALGRSDGSLGFPVSVPKAFALHRFHSAGVTMSVKWLALRDHLDSLS